MKKKIVTILGAAIAIIFMDFLYRVNKPYKPPEPKSFTLYGVYSALIENGGTLILNLPDSSHNQWEIISNPEPECFRSDYHTEYDNGTEFHIIAITDGQGEMGFQCTQKDGSVEKYKLTLSISRHKKIYLQIDTILFEKYE